jgi:Ca2+-binding RTX toxin-like protein
MVAFQDACIACKARHKFKEMNMSNIAPTFSAMNLFVDQVTWLPSDAVVGNWNDFSYWDSNYSHAITGGTVTSVSSGTLMINGTPWDPQTNNLIDSLHHGIWASDASALGWQLGYTMQANYSIDVPESSILHMTIGAQVYALSTTSGSNAPEEVALTFDALQLKSDAADSDGHVQAFLVASLTSGSLRIGSDAQTATPWDAVSNALIDAAHIAFWTPDSGAQGTLNAFAVLAVDDALDTSSTPVAVQVNVDVNYRPLLDEVYMSYEDVTSGTDHTFTLSDMLRDSNATDSGANAPNGLEFWVGMGGGVGFRAASSLVPLQGFVVTGVTSGSLRIGSSSATATPWDATTNHLIDATHNAYWRSDDNATGEISAFTVVALDNDMAASSTPVQVLVGVYGNTAPTVSYVDLSNYDFTPNAEIALSFNAMNGNSNAHDYEGSVQSFVVTGVTSGALRIGISAATATAWDATSNHVIDAAHSAYWTPAANAQGTLNAFTVLARDDVQAISSTPVQVQVGVYVNHAPTVNYVDLSNYDFSPNAEIALRFNAMYNNSDADDYEGSVEAFVVTGVTTGGLRIGSSAATATAWDATSNNVVDATHNAYWTPAAGAQGTLNAFTVLARDSDQATSETPVQVQVGVYVNQAPTVSYVDFTDYQFKANSEIALSFNAMNSNSDTYDDDGTVQAFVVTGVTTGALRIGSSAATATVWNATSNNVVDATHSAYWTPAADAQGTLNAFTVLARDNDLTASSTPVQVQVGVRANQAPTVSYVDLSDYDEFAVNAEIALTFTIMKNNSDEQDTDGSVQAFVVTSVTSGTLRIGSTVATATVWDAASNKVIDATHIAYWTPAADAQGTTNAFAVVARDNELTQSSTPVQVLVNILPNEAPSLSLIHLTDNGLLANAESSLSFYNLRSHSDADDSDGSVVGFDVSGVTSGSLRIGASAQTATAWDAVTNHVIDAAHTAYWAPALNALGNFNAFTVKAVDDKGARSDNAVQLTLNVESLAPQLLRFDGPVAQASVGSEREITYSTLTQHSDVRDRDGNLVSFDVTSVSSGSLRIGRSASTATPWDAQTNHLINAQYNAYWSPSAEAAGKQAAFTVLARDSDGLPSSTPVTVSLQVKAPSHNSAPVLEDMGIELRHAPDGRAYYVAPDASVEDEQLAELNGVGNYSGASVSLARLGTPTAADVFFGIGDLSLTGGQAVLSGVNVGSVTASTGALQITFNVNATQARVNDVLSSIAYQNEHLAGGVNKIQWTFNDGSQGSVGATGTATAFSVLKVSGAGDHAGTWTKDVLTLQPGVAGSLSGDMGDDSLTGSDFDDYLDGGSGKDKMAGGMGNDVYVVDSTSDVVTEGVDGGIDTVEIAYLSSSYTLGANVENLNYIGGSKFSAKGNALDNHMEAQRGAFGNVKLDGGAGNDQLVGGTASDALLGGDGNDTLQGCDGANSLKGGNGHDLITAGVGDDKVEGGEGNDTVMAGAGADDVKGGNGDDQIYTGVGNDKIDGGDGADRIDAGDGNNGIKGGLGDDHIVSGADNDTIDGGAGNDFIDAGYGANSVKGGDGDDVLIGGSEQTYKLDAKLDGGAGNDVLKGLANTFLIGGAGADTFVFDHLAVAGHANTIKDFKVVDDTIQLDHLVFEGLGSVGPLLATAFKLGTQATTTEQRIIVDNTHRTVSYDDDGSGVHAAVVITNILGNLTKLTEADFQII